MSTTTFDKQPAMSAQQNLKQKNILTVSEAAFVLGISSSTLRRLEKEGKITSVRQDNGYRVFSKTDVYKLLDFIKHEKEQTAVNKEKGLNTSRTNEKIIEKNIKGLKSIQKGFKLATLGMGATLTLLLIVQSMTNGDRLQKRGGNVLGIIDNIRQIVKNDQKSKEIKDDNILGLKDRIQTFIFDINVPSFFKKDTSIQASLSVSQSLTVSQLSTLLGGISTPQISSVTNIDGTTKSTLERILTLTGDVIGVLNANTLNDTITYSGDWDFDGTWAIGGEEVEATAEELNILAGTSITADELELLEGLTSTSVELNYLDGTTVTTGGVMFGNGSYITQNPTKFYWDNTNFRLAIGGAAPTEALDVTGRVHLSQTTAPATTTDKLYNVAGTLYWAGSALNGSGGILPGGVLTGETLYWNGSNWVNSSNLFHNGTNVGVGTSTPDSLYHIVGGDTYLAPNSGYTFNNPTANEDLYVYGNIEADGTIYGTDFSCTDCLDWSEFSDTMTLDATTTINMDTNSANLNFDSGTLFIGYTGNVGIGSSSPVAKLDVTGTAWLRGANANQGLYVSSSGNVGVGTTAPTQKLTLEGNFLQTNDTAPTALSTITTGANGPLDVFVVNNYAYSVSMSSNSIMIFDISDPSSMLAKGTSTTNLNSPRAVYVQGNYAYVASNGNNALAIFDISNPDSIVAKSYITTNLNGPRSVYVSGKYAYVASGGNNALAIFDISDPSNPIALGYTTTGLNYPRGVFVKDDYAYVASANNNTLAVFNVSNPNSITSTDTITTGLNYPTHVYVSGRYAYVASYNNNTLAMFDISNPADISAKDTITTNLSSPIKLVVAGKYAYVASYGNSRIAIFDISNPADISAKSYISTNVGSPYSVAVNGRNVYSANFGGATISSYVINNTEVPSLFASSARIDNLQVFQPAFFENSLSLGGGLTVGTQGILTRGGIAQTSSTSTNIFAGNVGIGTTSPPSLLSVGTTSQFRVDTSGNITRINNVVYSWPSSQGSTSSILTNNGSGTLTWADSSGTGILGYWQRNGTTVTPTTLTDSLSIGSTTPSSALFYVPGSTNSNAWFSLGTGNLGIGTTVPMATLHVLDTTEQLRLGYDGSNYMSFTVDSAGNLTFADTGTNVATFGATGASFEVPTSFNAAGDASVAYDMVFTNQTSSNIKSWGPLTIEVGESWESNDLTLKTYNSGEVVFDSPSGLSLVQAQTWDLLDSSVNALSFESTLLSLDTLYSRVGIGNTSPVATLDLSGTAYLRGASANQGLYVNSSGNVGIGTTSPAYDLDVDGDIRIAVNSIFYLNPNTDTYLQYGQAVESFIGGYSTYFRNYNNFVIEAGEGLAAGKILFATNDASRMVIDGTGNVGIGTTSPSGTLHVQSDLTAASFNGSTRAQLNISGSTDSTKRLLLGFDTDTNIGVLQTVQYGVSWATYNLALQPKGGNLGVGTTAPDAKLHEVGGDVYVAPDSGYTFNNGSANEDLYVYGNLEVDGTLYTAAQSIAGNLLPATDNTYDLGSATYRWQDLYLGPASLNISDTAGTSGAGTDYVNATLGYTGEQLVLATSLAGAQATGGNILIQSAYPLGGGATEAISFKTTANMGAADELFQISDAGGDLFTMLGNGNVGIGNTAPTEKLTVTGNVASQVATGAEGYKLTDTTDTTKLAMKWSGTNVTLDVPSGSTTNKLSNGTFDTDLASWNYGYTLEDQFTTDRAAGSVNGTSAEPTGGTRTVTDTNSKLSITGSQLSFETGGVGWGNPGIWYPAVTRVAGKLLVGDSINISATGNQFEFGFDTNTVTFADEGSVLYFLGSDIQTINNSVNTTVGSFSATTNYSLAIVLRSSGAYHFIKGGSFTNWTLLSVNSGGVAGTLYPTITNLNTTFTADNMRVPTNLWLPTPLAYDTFAATYPTQTEVTGPDSQITPQLTWTGGAKVGGAMVITPTAGGDLLTNGDMELDANWADYLTPTTNARSNEQAHAGTYSRKVVGDSSGDGTSNSGFAGTTDKWYSMEAWLYISANTSAGAILNTWTGSANASSAVLSTLSTWTKVPMAFRATSTSTKDFRIYQQNSGAITFYADDAVAKELTTSSLFSTVSTSDADVVADVTISALTTGTQGGLVLNLDSAASPDDFILVYHNGTQLLIDEVVNGVYTNKQTTTVALGAGALRVVRDGTKLRAYLNNALVGSELTMTANTNTRHGMFSTYSGNTFDNFSLFARGTGGEYDIPDASVTTTRDTSTFYGGTASVKLISGANQATTFLQSINVGDTSTYNLTAYAYTDGSAVTTADLDLYYDTQELSTTFTSVGGGWYRLSGTLTGVASSKQYGVKVHAGKTVYVDGISLFTTSGSSTALNISNSLTGLGQMNVESTTTLNSGLADLQALIVKGYSGQSANLTEWQNSSGTALSSINSSGYLNIPQINALNSNGLKLYDDGGNGIFVKDGGNVGIGTTNPGYKLEVSGTNSATNLYVTGLVSGQSYGALNGITLVGTLYFSDSNGYVTRAGNQVGLYGVSGTYLRNSAGYTLNVDASGNLGLGGVAAATTPSMYIKVSDGNVGIGTTNPASFKLEVAGNIGPEATNTQDLGSSSRYFANAYITNLYSGSTGTFGYWIKDGTTLVPSTVGDTIATTGNIGIGITGPTSLLHLYNGTASPIAKIEGGSTSDQTLGPVLTLDRSAVASASQNATIKYSTDGVANWYAGLFTDSTDAHSGKYFIDTGTAITATPALVIQSADKNVGIGTHVPGQKLDVAGEIELANYVYFGNGATEYLRWDASDFLLSDDFLPNANDTLNLGSDTARWAASYIGPGTLHIGTSTADEYTMSYDTNADSLGFNVNGSGDSEIVMNSSGNLGVGTTNPKTKLEVLAGDINIDYDRRIYGYYNGSPTVSSYIELYNGSDAGISIVNRGSNGGIRLQSLSQIVFKTGGDSEKMRLNSSGNLGIGTTAPVAKLNVSGGNIRVDTGDIVVGTTNRFLYMPGAGIFNIGDSEDTVAFNGANIGIGTTAPSAKLDMRTSTAQVNVVSTTGTNVARILLQNNAYGYIGMERSTGGQMFTGTSPYAMAVGTVSAYPLQFATDNTTRMAIDTAGNVGIGTTAPAGKLDVAGTAYLRGAAGTQGLSVGSDGNVGIGTYAPSYGALSVAKSDGTAYASTVYTSSGASMGVTSFMYNASNATNSFSGIRFGNRDSSAAFWGILSVQQGASASDLVFGNNASAEVSRITSTGNLGLGTSAPTSKLDISGIASFAAAGVDSFLTESHTVNMTGAESATYATMRNVELGRVTYTGTNASQTITTASTLYVSTPAASTNVTITNLKPIDTQTGAYLSGVGVWEDNSSKTVKENYTEIDLDSLLTKLETLPITEWNYIMNDDNIRHIGPFAEDFYSVIGVGESNKHIAALDTSGVALAGVKGLLGKVTALETQTGTQNSDLQNIIDDITTQLTQNIDETQLLNDNLDDLSSRIVDLENSLLSSTPETTETTQTTQSTPTEMLAGMQKIFDDFKEFIAAVGLSSAKDENGVDILTVSSDMNVTGSSTFADVTITGNLTAGLLKFNTVENSLNIIGSSCFNEATNELDEVVCNDQALYIQKSLAGNVNLFDGKVLIKPNGTLEVKGTVLAKKYNVDSSAENPSAGRIVINAGDTKVEISTSSLTDKSLIIATPDKPISVGAKKTADGKFEIEINEIQTEDVEISWWIIN